MSSALSLPMLAPPLPNARKKSTKKSRSKQNAQAQLTQFWSQYHSKTPARVTSIFPKKLYDGLIPVEDTPGPQIRNAARSYEEARAKCKELVRRAVAECERMNSRFVDAEFDIEADLENGDTNYLYGLGHESFRCCDEEDDESDPAPGRKVSGWEMQMALDSIAKSEVLKDNTATFKLDKLQKYVGTDIFSGLCMSHYTSPPESVHRLDWIFENPQFTVGGYSSSDIKQGKCGDCWWLAALASIAHRKDLMDKICVARDEECGVYGFVFWKDGEWITTIIDDNLYVTEKDYGKYRDTYDPTGKKARLHRKEKQTGSKALYFSHCEDENETWLPLLEKAYAKVHGDYEAIDGGWSGAAVEDLTGGVTTMLAGNAVLRKDRLWREFVKSGGEDGEFVFALSARCGWPVQNGITLNHAYSVLRAVEVQDEDGQKHRLVQVRNPWGQRSSKGMGVWFGAWSDGSREWTPYMMQKMKHQPGDDGKFWISFADLLENFQWVHRTRLFDARWTISQQWISSKVSWVTGYIHKKFIIDVKEGGLVVISLSQLDDRYFKGLEGQYEFKLDFLLRKTGTTAPLCQVRTTHKYDNRSASCELELEPGTYEVLPKVTAERNTRAKTTGKMVSTWADKNPEKLRQIGMQYDAAHAKAGVIDEDEEVEKLRQKREERKKKKKEKKRKEEKAMKKIQKTLMEKRIPERDEDEEDDSDVEATMLTEWLRNKLTKNKKKGKQGGGRSVKALVKALKSGDSASSKLSLPEASVKEAESEEDGSSTAGSHTPPSTVKEESEEKENKAEEVPDSDVDDLSDSSEESESEEEPDFDKKQPWDPVCVMGLRVYAQDCTAVIRLSDKEAGEDYAAQHEAPSAVKS